jgi:hypothetical protein
MRQALRLLCLTLLTHTISVASTKPPPPPFLELDSTDPSLSSCTSAQVFEANERQLGVILEDLVETEFFKHFRVDLGRDCKFWRKDGSTKGGRKFMHIDDADQEEARCMLVLSASVGVLTPARERERGGGGGFEAGERERFPQQQQQATSRPRVPLFDRVPGLGRKRRMRRVPRCGDDYPRSA